MDAFEQNGELIPPLGSANEERFSVFGPGPASATASGVHTAGVSGTTGSTPSWISSLQTSIIKTDMAAAGVNGTVSEAGMAKLFTDLAAQLTSTKTTLTSTELSDLKIIAADLNVGETASSYLTYITGALILGNAANANWTGGAASSKTLGNLAVGDTAAQISELDGKWFLGTDLPSDLVKMSGVSSFTVSYSADTNPLYSGSGPTINDVNQGYLGDCYLESVLAEVAFQSPSAIESMLTSNGNNTYGVRFYVNGVGEYVTVSDMLADGGTIFNTGANYSSGPDIWASIVEQGYAQLQGGGNVTGNTSAGSSNSWGSIGNGGYAEYTLVEVTGASSVTDFNAARSTWTQDVYNNKLVTQSARSGLSTASVLSTIASDVAIGDDVILSSYTNAYDTSGHLTLISDHAMSVYGYDSKTGMLEIRNPWGTDAGQNWDTTFEVSLAALLKDGDTISIANTGTVGSLGGTSAHTPASAIGQAPAAFAPQLPGPLAGAVAHHV